MNLFLKATGKIALKALLPSAQFLLLNNQGCRRSESAGFFDALNRSRRRKRRERCFRAHSRTASRLPPGAEMRYNTGDAVLYEYARPFGIVRAPAHGEGRVMPVKSPSGSACPYYFENAELHPLKYGSCFSDREKLLRVMKAEEAFILGQPGTGTRRI